MKKVFGSVMLVAGTIMGAGFCSGKEIVTYFAKFGFKSLYFIPLLFLLYYFIFKLFLFLGAKEKFDNIEDINKKIFKKGTKFSNFLLFVVYLIFTSAMFAGIREIAEMFNWEPLVYILLAITFILAFIMLLKPFKSLKTINAILVPFLIVLVSFTVITGLAMFGLTTDKLIVIDGSILLGINPIIYACQGLALAYFILIKTGDSMTKKQINLTAFFSALILCVLQGLAISVFSYNPELLNETMPFVALSMKIGFGFDILYLIVLFIAIFTTLLSTSRPLNEIINIKVANVKCASFISLFTALILSFFGFEKIIQWFYPIIGIIGFIILMLVVFQLSFINFFKFTHKKVHTPSKNAKDDRTCHD